MGVEMSIFEELYDYYEQQYNNKWMEGLSEISFSHLTISHFEYLTTIKNMGRPSISILAEALKFAVPSVTIMVNKLVKEGLLIKIRSEEDKRVYEVELTELGHELIGMEKNTFTEISNELTSNLSEDELEQLTMLMKKGLDLVKKSHNKK